LMPIAAAQCQRGGGQSPGASTMANTQGSYMQTPFGPMGLDSATLNRIHSDSLLFLRY
jgi:hypothetical protein